MVTAWRNLPMRYPVIFFGRPFQQFLLRHRRAYGWFIISIGALALAAMLQISGGHVVG